MLKRHYWIKIEKNLIKFEERFPVDETIFTKEKESLYGMQNWYIQLCGQKLARAIVLTTQFDSVEQNYYVNIPIICLNKFNSKVQYYTIIVIFS